MTTDVAFPRYFSDNITKVRIISRHKSWFMRLCGFGLSITNALRLSKIENFMNGYITTIGRTIYGKSDWSMDMEFSSILLHELTHVMLRVMRGIFKYDLEFLLSKDKRAYFESICCQAQMMQAMAVGKEGYTPMALERRAMHFVPYGIIFTVMLKELSDRYTEILDDRPQPEAFTVVEAWKSWKGVVVQEK